MHRIITFLKSATVGAASTAIDLLILTVLVELVHLDPQHANLPALLAGVAFQFFGNKHFAFNNRRTDHNTLTQGALFALVEVGALLLNASLFHFATTVTAMPYLAARVLTQAFVYTGFSLPWWSRIFSPATAQPRSAS